MIDVNKNFEVLKALAEQKDFITNLSDQSFERDEIVDFLISLLRGELADELEVVVLDKLVNIGYCDKYLYSYFAASESENLKDIALKGLLISEKRGSIIESELVELMGEGYSQYLIEKIRGFLRKAGGFREGVVLGLLGSEDVRIRAAVMESLDKDQDMIEGVLVHAVMSGSVVWYVRSSVAEILGKRRSNLLLTICDKLSEDKNVEVKLSTIRALGEFPPEDTEVYIKRFIDDRNLWVKKEAEKFLENQKTAV